MPSVPSDKSLGYSRTSLRDWTAMASCTQARSRRQIPLARPRNLATPFPVSRTFQMALGPRVTGITYRWTVKHVAVATEQPTRMAR